MKKLTFKCMMAASTALVAGLSRSDTLALYPFECGTAGQTVSSMANAASPGTYDAAIQVVGTGTVPFWTNSVPGNCVFSDSACTNMIASMPMAVRFEPNAEDSGPNYASGGVMELSGLGTVLKTADEFTVEWFWKPDGWIAQARMMFLSFGGDAAIAVADANANGAGIRFHTAWDGVTESPYAGSWADTEIYKNGWQHWAVTGNRQTGEFKCYYRGNLVATRTNTTPPEAAATPRLLFGAGSNWDGSGAFNRCNRGDLTCIRVSDKVLEPSQFMRMGAAAFYAFKDGVNNQEVTSVTNALVADGVVGSVDSKAGMPKFSSDRPGRYVYATSKRDRLLCENPNSIRFPTATNNYWSTCEAGIYVPQLGGRLAMLLDEMNEFTVECFFKHVEPGHGWGGSYLVTFSGETNFNNPWSANWNRTSVISKQKNKDAYTSTSENGNEDMTDDGLWHHAAYVFRKNSRTTKTVEVYLDYAKAPGQADGSFDFTANTAYRNWNDGTFAIGRPLLTDGLVGNFANTFLGHIACVRILPAALAPSEFMVATDVPGAPVHDVRLHWRFEEGAAGASLATAADSSGAGRWAVGKMTSYGAGGTAPTYSKTVPASTLTNVLGLARNTRSLAFVQPNEGGHMALGTKEWYGMPSLHPVSWTVEVFVRPVAVTAEGLIVGRGRMDPTTGDEWYDWALVLQPNGRLGLKGYRVDTGGAGGKTAYSYSDIGDVLVAGGWHHVAVTYADSTCALSVFVDSVPKFSVTLASAQFDNLLGRYMVGDGCGQGGYAGLIDEVRLTGHVLAVSEFMRSRTVGAVIIMR